jgi:hypothetical protein
VTTLTAPEPLESPAGVSDHPWRFPMVPSPGILRLDYDRLTFTTDRGEVLFDTPLSGIEKLKVPWYQLGNGFFLTIAGQKYLVTFFKIPGAPAGIARAWLGVLRALLPPEVGGTAAIS